MSRACEVIVPNSAWFSQRCNEPSAVVVTDAWGDHLICAKHAHAIATDDA